MTSPRAENDSLIFKRLINRGSALADLYLCIQILGGNPRRVSGLQEFAVFDKKEAKGERNYIKLFTAWSKLSSFLLNQWTGILLRACFFKWDLNQSLWRCEVFVKKERDNWNQKKECFVSELNLWLLPPSFILMKSLQLFPTPQCHPYIYIYGYFIYIYPLLWYWND